MLRQMSRSSSFHWRAMRNQTPPCAMLWQNICDRNPDARARQKTRTAKMGLDATIPWGAKWQEYEKVRYEGVDVREYRSARPASQSEIQPAQNDDPSSKPGSGRALA